MKNYLYIIITLLFIISCNENTPPQIVEAQEVEDTSHVIPLNQEQISTAGIQVGKATVRAMSGELKANGRIELPPNNRISIHSTIVGYVKEVNFLVGSRVQKGDVLCILEHPAFIEKQRQLLELKARIPFLEQELKRKKELKENEAGSIKNYQSALSDYELARATYAGLRIELELLGFNVAKIENKNAYQSQLVIAAPSSGLITQQNINLGMLVHPEIVLYEIADLSHPHAELAIYAQDLPFIKIGQKVEFQIVGIDKIYKGSIHEIANVINPDTKTGIAHVDIEGITTNLSPGSTVQARIFTNSTTSLSLPKDAVVEKEGKYYVIEEKNGIFQSKQIQPTKQDENNIAFAANETSNYIVKNAYYLKEYCK